MADAAKEDLGGESSKKKDEIKGKQGRAVAYLLIDA